MAVPIVAAPALPSPPPMPEPMERDIANVCLECGKEWDDGHICIPPEFELDRGGFF